MSRVFPEWDRAGHFSEVDFVLVFGWKTFTVEMRIVGKLENCRNANGIPIFPIVGTKLNYGHARMSKIEMRGEMRERVVQNTTQKR